MFRTAYSAVIIAFLSISSLGQQTSVLPRSKATAGKITAHWDYRFGPAPKPRSKNAEKFLGWKIASRMGADYSAKFSRRPSQLKNMLESPLPAGLSIANDGLGLQLRPNIQTGYIPTGVVHADFNHDGEVDWAISMGGDSTVWIYLGHGDGTFDVPKVVPLRGVSPTNIDVADLNADGNADIILPEVDSGTVGVLMGNADGTFRPEELYQLPTSVAAVAVADFNQDGNLDVAAGIMDNREYGAIALLLGDGTGHLGAPITTPSQLWGNVAPIATWLSVGDFNHDGLPDLVVRDDNGVVWTSGTYVYTNTGSGTFVIQGLYGWGFSSVVADFNEDGWDDIGILEGDDIYLMTGNADGSITFDSTLHNAYGQASVSYIILAADFNGDGHLDLASTPITIGSLSGYGQDSGSLTTVMFGNGDGTFGPGHAYRGHTSAYGADVFDMNGDGKPDILTANQDLDDATIYFNVGDGTFGYPKGEYIGYIRPEFYTDARNLNGPRSKAIVVDLNQDGRPDVLAASLTPYSHDLLAVLQGSDGNFSEKKYSPIVQDPLGFGFDLVVGDFRNTGRQDAVYILSNGPGTGKSGFIFAANQGDGSFVPFPITLTDAADYSSAAAGDFNNDGKLDLAIVGGIPARLYAFLGKGDGTFVATAPVVASSDESEAYLTYVRDFTGDGVPDVLVNLGYNDTRPAFAVLLAGKGNGTFVGAKVVLQDSSLFAVGDVNGDGLTDVVEFSLMWGENSISVWKANAGGTFTKQSDYSLSNSGGIQSDALGWLMPGRELSPPELADFDGDGKLDILVYLREQNAALSHVSAQFLKGAGNGNFGIQPSRFDLVADMGPSTAADIDGDGRAELVELDGRTSSFHVIKTTEAPALHLSLVGDPVTADTGIVRVGLATPQSTNTEVALYSSEPSISLPVSVTIPAGAISVDATFGVSARPAVDTAFTILGTSGELTSSVTGTLAGVTNNAGIELALQYYPTFVPGTIGTVTFQAFPLGGYEGDISFSCSDFPATIACSFSTPSLHITSNTSTLFAAYLDISGSASPGSYVGNIVVTDGAASWITPLKVNIGDFAVLVPQPIVSVPKNSVVATYQVYVDVTYGLSIHDVSFTCENLPGSLTCNPQIGDSPGTLVISGIPSTSLGTYHFVLNAKDGPVERKTDLTLIIGPSIVTLPATDIAATSATLHGSGNPGGMPLSVWFQYGTASDLSGSTSSNTQSLGLGNSLVNVDLSIAGLTANTQYYYRIISGGEKGEILNFTTSPDPSTTLSISASELDFGYQSLNNASSSKTITLTAGSKTVLVSGISSSSDFQQTNDCGSSLSAHGTCNINVIFQPSSSGVRTGSVTIKTNAVGHPHIVSLTGSGTDFSISSSQPSATVASGSPASYILSFAGTQNFAGVVSFSCSNLPSYANCQFTPNTVSLNGTNAQDATLSISTKMQTTGALTTPVTYFSIILFIPGIWAVRRARKTITALLAVAVMGAVVVLGSCGGGGANGTIPPPPVTRTTPPGTYNVVVTARVGNLSHTQMVTLIVQ